jgi:hypothetical protein
MWGDAPASPHIRFFDQGETEMRGSKMKVVAALAAVAAWVLPMSAASAAERDLEFTSTGGTVAIGELEPLEATPGNAGLSGTWDDETGEFVGTTQFNPATIPAAPPERPVAVVVQLANDADNVTGTIDPETGDAELTAVMRFVVEIPAISTTCTSAEYEVDFVSSEPFAPLPFDESADYTLSLDGEFSIPAVDLDAGCSPANATVAGLINSTVGLPADGTSTLGLVRGTPAPPTTPTTPTTTATTSTTAAVVATAQPRLTG